MTRLSDFLPGQMLSERFYREAVQPLLQRRFPELLYSAARLDTGSDVLGFDSPRSMDHGWGPRLNLFLSEEDFDRHFETVFHALRHELPREVAGYSTHFSEPQTHLGTMEPSEEGPINPGIWVLTVRSFQKDYLGTDPDKALKVADWLLIPEQRLCTVASGKVFHDGLGTLNPLRDQFSYYPKDLWLYLMAAQWQRIDQEEAFMGRCGEAGDELGSRLLAARRIHDLMRLGFYIERVYPPYSKWFGTAFSRLDCGPRLTPLFARIWTSKDWREREESLSDAYVAVAEMHNSLGITPPLSTKISDFYSRPYKVLGAARFVQALRDAIESDEVRNLPPHIGSINQVTDATDLLERPDLLQRFKGIYASFPKP